MTAAKHLQQHAARALRREGRSLRQIARELGVSLASASVWTRGIEPTQRPGPPAPAASVPVPAPERWCAGCQRPRPADCFHRGQTRCKECRAEYMRQRGELHRRQTREARERRRAEARRYLFELLTTGPCQDCGQSDPLVLEFDHVGPKTAAVSVLVHEGYSVDRVSKEIAACDLVCANCHRRRTALRGQSWRVDPELQTVTDDRPLKRRNLLFLLDYLRRSSCFDCGESDPVVLEFDHVGPKRGSVVWLAFREHSIASLEREIAQCVIRCVNCHRRETIRRQPGHLRHHLLAPP
jgi:hypothetical protein